MPEGEWDAVDADEAVLPADESVAALVAPGGGGGGKGRAHSAPPYFGSAGEGEGDEPQAVVRLVAMESGSCTIAWAEGRTSRRTHEVQLATLTEAVAEWRTVERTSHYRAQAELRGLQPLTVYRVRVRHTDEPNAPFSRPLTISTCSAVPPAPHGLRVLELSGADVRVGWEAVRSTLEPVTAYTIDVRFVKPGTHLPAEEQEQRQQYSVTPDSIECATPTAGPRMGYTR